MFNYRVRTFLAKAELTFEIELINILESGSYMMLTKALQLFSFPALIIMFVLVIRRRWQAKVEEQKTEKKGKKKKR